MIAYLLVHDDTDGIVQQALTKDDAVQLRIDLVLIEDGKNRDWIGGGERRSKDETFN
jgi:hypothetical protein